MQAKIRQELLVLTPTLCSPSEEQAVHLPSAKDLLGLSLLNSIIMETLRLYPSVPGPQLRVTPRLHNRLGVSTTCLPAWLPNATPIHSTATRMSSQSPRHGDPSVGLMFYKRNQPS